MTSSIILRRAAARRVAATTTVLPSARSRSYATRQEEEVDPQLNGYPQLPFVSRQHLPAKGWWDQQMRRNFGDTVHEQDEVLSMWGPDIPGVPPRTALFQFTLATLAFVGFGFLVKSTLIPDRTAVPRQYPFSGLVTELGGLEENKASEEEVDEE